MWHATLIFGRSPLPDHRDQKQKYLMTGTVSIAERNLKIKLSIGMPFSAQPYSPANNGRKGMFPSLSF